MADRGIAFYADAATRSQNQRGAQPVIGDMSFLRDTGALEVYYGALYGWRPPWTTPWGEVARATLTANSPALPSYDGIPVVDLTLVTDVLFSNRQYEAVFEGLITSSVNGEIVVVNLHYSGGVATCTDLHGVQASPVIFQQAFKVSMSGSAGDTARWSERFTWAQQSAPQATFYVTGANLTGLGTAQLLANQYGATRLRIIDLGPAGDPVYP